MKIAYVCTNYNNSSFTLAAVDSLMKNAGHDIEVVVVDNASQPDEKAKLQPLAQKYPTVHVIEHPDNTGYFRGLNVGLHALHRRRPDIDWVIVGNNDLEFAPDFCDKVEQVTPALKAHSVISPDIVTLDGMHQNPHVISEISKFRELIYDLYYMNYYLAVAIRKFAKLTEGFTERADRSHHDVAQEIYQGHGACYVLGPVFFQHFQELWAPSFLMHEEYFLSKQLSDKGLHVYYEPSIRVVHLCHAAMSKIPGRKVWQAARDAHKIYRQHVKIFD